MHANRIFTNGQIVTVDNDALKTIRGLRYKVKKLTAQFPIYEKGAVAIRGTEIVGVGPAADVLNVWKGPKTQVLDLKGKVVIPGLMDSHCHSESLGNDLQYGMDLTSALSAEEILNQVQRFIEEKNIGTADQ